MIRPRSDDPIVIVGAGPSGLGAAYMLDRCGLGNWVVLERDDGPGGLSRSIVDEHGCTWDIGGHITFSHYGLYTRLLDGLLGDNGWIEHERESWVRLLGAWIPYPLQNNLHLLPPEQRARCIEGLLRAAEERSAEPFSSFDDFIVRTFGRGLADLFMRPYNFKVWGYHPSKMTSNWIADRVAIPDPSRAARNPAPGQQERGWGPNSRFRFPVRGGTGAIWQALAERLPPGKIVHNADVVAIDVERKTVSCSNGASIKYDSLISSMPLDRLAAVCSRREWSEAASGLAHSSLHVVGVALNGSVAPQHATRCWMYFPENDCPFYRVTHFSRYSPNNVDDIGSRWSLMCEISQSPDKPVDAAQVVAQTIDGLAATGLIESPNQVHHTWRRFVEYSYPTPSVHMDRIVHRLLPEMERCDILSRGRFGSWRYEVGNMDHCFMQGVEAVAHILLGTPELTLWEPALVNSPHPVLGWDRFR